MVNRVSSYFPKGGHSTTQTQTCETQLIETIDNIARHLSDGSQVDAILLDFEKAFDKVPYSRLLNKLDFYGVRGNINSWIKASLVIGSNKSSSKVLNPTKKMYCPAFLKVLF